MKPITKTQLKALEEVLQFVEAYVDYHIGDKNMIDGEPTDAEILSKYIPQLKSVFGNGAEVEYAKNAAKEWKESPSEASLKDIIYTERRNAKESVNPNYKYCVTNCDVSVCYLTDSETAAMEFAVSKSKCDTDRYNTWRVLKIMKSKDGTYKTYIVGRVSEGHYYDNDKKNESFLHFNYIAEAAEASGGIHKI